MLSFPGRVVLNLAVFCASCFMAEASNAQTIRGYTCMQVREAVIKYGGPENAESLARSYGGTEREIAAARRCLVRPKYRSAQR